MMIETKITFLSKEDVDPMPSEEYKKMVDAKQFDKTDFSAWAIQEQMARKAKAKTAHRGLAE